MPCDLVGASTIIDPGTVKLREGLLTALLVTGPPAQINHSEHQRLESGCGSTKRVGSGEVGSGISLFARSARTEAGLDCCPSSICLWPQLVECWNCELGLL